MKQYRELAIGRFGFWYRRYISCDATPKSISPRSYRAGVEVGWIGGLGIGFMAGVMFLAAVFGFGS